MKVQRHSVVGPQRSIQRSIYHLFTGFVVAAALFVLPCAYAHEVLDTGVLGRNDVFWIDNQQILFPGYQKQSASGHGAAAQPVLLVWHVGARRVRVHSEIPEGGYVCYADGHIAYTILKNGKRYIREGQLGAEHERELLPSAPGSKIHRNEFTCKNFELSSADRMHEGFLFIPLRDGDGYYGWPKKGSPLHQADPTLFFLPATKTAEPIALPIRDTEKRRMTYSQYLAAYVIERSELTRKDTDGMPSGKVWLLFPATGKISEAEMPRGGWLRATWGYAPTRKGWVVSSRATGRRSNLDLGEAGLYLVKEDVAKRIVVGFPSAPAVSPDGCMVAVVVNPLTGPGLKATLRVADLCK